MRFDEVPMHDIVKFLSRTKTDKNTGCIEMQTKSKKNTYYQFKSRSKKIYGHRFSFLIHNGYLPKDLFVCHSCDNKKCVNPKHLWLGTNSDNLKDCVKKGRHNNQNSIKKQCLHGHELSGDNLYMKPNGTRHCYVCRKKARRERYLTLGV